MKGTSRHNSDQAIPIPASSKASYERLDRERTKYKVEHQLVSHQVRRKRALFLDSTQCLLGVAQIIIVSFEYQSFIQPVIQTPFQKGKDWYKCDSRCENLRAINVCLNILVLVLSVVHYFIRYQSAVFEGLDYVAEKQSTYGYF